MRNNANRSLHLGYHGHVVTSERYTVKTESCASGRGLIDHLFSNYSGVSDHGEWNFKLKSPRALIIDVTYCPHCHRICVDGNMSQTPSLADSPSNYRYIFDRALEAYKEKTGKDLTSDPLLHKLETCHSPDNVLVILRERISEFDQPHNNSDGLKKCLNPTVNVLYTFSTIIGVSPGLVSLGILVFFAV
jgi:hypothetical protein